MFAAGLGHGAKNGSQGFNVLANILAFLGSLDEARSAGGQALAITRAQNDRRFQGYAEAYLSVTECLAGDYARAESYARAAVTTWETVLSVRPFASALLARALLAQGRLVEALSSARDAYSQLESLGAVDDGAARAPARSSWHIEEGNMFVPVVVNGVSGDYILDTGANISVLSVSEAQRLGLKLQGGQGTGKDYAGNNLAFQAAIGAMVSGILAREVPAERRSATLNLVFLPLYLGGIVGPALGSAVVGSGLRTVFYLAALVLVGGLVMAIAFARRTTGDVTMPRVDAVEPVEAGNHGPGLRRW